MSRKTIAVAAIVLSTCLAAACRAPGIAARSEPAPRARAPQEGHAEGDLLQELKQVQETLSRVESNQRAQSSELAGRIGDVDRMVQQVEKQMYGPSPEQLQLEQDRLGKQTVFGLAGVGILVGLALFALWAPSVGGSWLAVAAIALVTLSVLAPLFYLLS